MTGPVLVDVTTKRIVSPVAGIGLPTGSAFFYDGSNYFTITVASNGATTFNAVGAGASFVFSDSISGTAAQFSGGVEAGSLLSAGSCDLGAVTADSIATDSILVGGLAVLNQTNTVTGITNKTFTAPVLMAPVIGDGSGATAVLASNLSGATDPTITFGNAAVTVSATAGVSIGGGTIGTNALSVTGTVLITGNVTLASTSVTLNNTTALGFSDTWISRGGTAVMTINGGVSGTTQALSGAGAANLTSLSTTLTTAGTGDAISLANGINGQIKIIVLDVLTSGGHTSVLTPTTKTGFTTVTFAAAGDTVQLQYFTTRGWMVIGSKGVVIA